MIDNKEQITQIAYKKIVFSLIVSGFIYNILLLYKLLPNESNIFVLLVNSMITISSIFSLVSIYNNKFRIPTIFMLVVAIGVISVFPHIKIYLVCLIPVFLSIYTLNTRVILYSTIATFAIRTLDTIITDIIKGNLLVPKINTGSNVAYTICIICSTTIEFIFLLSVFIPIFKYLIDLKNSQELVIKEKENATEELLNFCSTATGYHDKYLSVHNKGVKELTQLILDELRKQGTDISDSYYNQIVFSVQFHDIGKMYIDSSILDKDGKLTDTEYKLIKEHPIKGSELFKLVPKNALNDEWMKTCNNIILQHHERLDGTGYPYHLKGNEVSFEAQIVAVADITDALLSWRPYKNPFTWEKLVDVLNKESKGLNLKFVDIILNNKEKVLDISNKNNILLQNMLKLKESELERL